MALQRSRSCPTNLTEHPGTEFCSLLDAPRLSLARTRRSASPRRGVREAMEAHARALPSLHHAGVESMQLARRCIVDVEMLHALQSGRMSLRAYDAWLRAFPAPHTTAHAPSSQQHVEDVARHAAAALRAARLFLTTP